MSSHSSTRIVVTIGGLPGSGTTTAAKLLSERLHIRWTNGGEIFRNMAKEKGMLLNEFGRYAEENPEIDRELDRRLIEIMRNENIILEGRLAGSNANVNKIPSLRVWLHAPFKTRAERIQNRDGVKLDKAMEHIHERERSEKERYLEYYNIDYEDLDHYSVVINSGEYLPAEIVEIIIQSMRAKGML